MRHFRRLADKAYEIELSKSVTDLYEQFLKWRSGDITVWDLSDMIHKFHDGESRELYKFYALGKNYQYQVARAIHNGCISMKDLEERYRREIQFVIDSYFKNVAGNPGSASYNSPQ